MYLKHHFDTSNKITGMIYIARPSRRWIQMTNGDDMVSTRIGRQRTISWNIIANPLFFERVALVEQCDVA